MALLIIHEVTNKEDWQRQIQAWLHLKRVPRSRFQPLLIEQIRSVLIRILGYRLHSLGVAIIRRTRKINLRV